MDIVDHVQNSKKLLINEILKTNDNIIFFQIYDKRVLLADIINKFKANDFYQLLALFNHFNYNGYFFQKEKEKLIKIINHNEENQIKNFLKIWLTKDFPNREILNIEIYALNILLEKMIVKGFKDNILKELEEIKYNLFLSTENLKNKFYNFKIRLITRDNKERDVYKTLLSIINGNHNLVIKDLVYIKNYYQDEIEILSKLQLNT